MNRNVLFRLWCIIIALSSCNSTHITEELGDEGVDEVNILIRPFEYENEISRASVDEYFQPIWEEKDTLGVYPTIGSQVEWPITSGYGESYAKFEGGGWAIKTNTYYHAYYPFNFYNRNSKAVPFSYIGQEQDGNNPQKHLGKYMFLATGPTISTKNIEKNKEEINFLLEHMGQIMIIELTLPEPTTYKSMSVYTNDNVFPIKKTFNLQTNNLEETIVEKSREVTLKLKNITTTKKNEKVTFYIVLPSVSENNYNHNLNVVIHDEYNFSYTAPLYKPDGTQAVTSMYRNTISYRFASPVLDKDFNMGVSNWGQGSNTQGSV